MTVTSNHLWIGRLAVASIRPILSPLFNHRLAHHHVPLRGQSDRQTAIGKGENNIRKERQIERIEKKESMRFSRREKSHHTQRERERRTIGKRTDGTETSLTVRTVCGNGRGRTVFGNQWLGSYSVHCRQQMARASFFFLPPFPFLLFLVSFVSFVSYFFSSTRSFCSFGIKRLQEG